jgi:integrase
MSESDSTAPRPVAKPAKPYADFPLFAHNTNRWAKKIHGKLHYFGPWNDPDGALERYLEQKNALYAGNEPAAEELTVKRLVNRFLYDKEMLCAAGEITPRTWGDYKVTGERLIKILGGRRPVLKLTSADFTRLRAALAKTLGPVALGNEINRVRVLFKFAADNALIDRPVLFGSGFKRPTKKVLRLEKAKKGPRLFTPPQIRAMVRKAGQPLKSMLLLAVNCGFGNNDVGTLPLSALDLAGGWVNYHRPKTGIDRRCPLWPETVQAIREALAARPEPKDPESAGLVFLTRFGAPWAKGTMDNPVSKEVAKLLNALKLHRSKGLGFYTLRHVFETVGGESKDQVAVDHIMGHARDDMASVYREKIGDGRLRAVAEHVRAWLFPAAAVPSGDRK